ncbi:MAG: hypothetical protein SPI65_04480 [Peptoniphilus sp.]|nr:hypothetical protein [Peptoniphilus sp.]MDD7363475.1 GntP family permease [Bacillota bacterium]MDY6044821.1 hypothetical protein [Peptoniphilus sp.]
MGVIGLLLALAVLIVMVYRGYHVLPVSLVASLIIFLTNRFDIWPGFMDGYAPAMTGFIANYLIMFLLGSVVGELLSKSGAASAIAQKLTETFGSQHALFIVILSSVILSYGGVSVFVIIFSIYPIALILFQQADIPKRVIPGAILLGAGTFTMTALPGTPALTNIIPTQYLGTTTTAAPFVGIGTSIVMFTVGFILFTAYIKKLRENGEFFELGEKDKLVGFSTEQMGNLPPFSLSIIPIIVIVGTILGLRFANIDIDSVYSVVIGLLSGAIVTYILFRKRLQSNMKASVRMASEGSINALMNTSSIVGFGGAIRLVPAFQAFVNFATSLSFSPLISAALAINIIAGVTGSSSAGITIFMDTMANNFLSMGVNPQLLHRIVAIGAGVLDSLPHAGPNVTILMVTGLSFKEGYPGIFLATCIVPLCGLITALILASLGIV